MRADPIADPRLNRELVNLCGIAGREVARRTAGWDGTGIWRDAPYFCRRTLTAMRPDPNQTTPKRFGLEIGVHVNDAIRTLQSRGYEVAPDKVERLHAALAATDALSSSGLAGNPVLVSITQDVAALGEFLKLKDIRQEQRPRYEAALEMRAAQMAQLCHYSHNDLNTQRMALETAAESFAKSYAMAR